MIWILNHSDEVSGTTVFCDGTKAYWTEGRSSAVRIVYKNGAHEWIEASFISDPKHPMRVALDYVDCHAENVAFREMTPEEELEWEKARS